MEPKRIPNYQEFWPFYLQEHSKPATRNLHYAGTSFFFLILFYAFYAKQWNFLWLLPLFGYGFAWVGHFGVEKNRPATFKYPIWSLISDFKMYFMWITGKLPAELKKHNIHVKIETKSEMSHQ